MGYLKDLGLGMPLAHLDYEPTVKEGANEIGIQGAIELHEGGILVSLAATHASGCSR